MRPFFTSRITSVLIPLTVAILPLFFLPFFSNQFHLPKLIAILIILGVTLISLGVDLVRERTIRAASFPQLTVLIGLIVMTLLNFFFVREARLETFLTQGLLFIALPLLTYAIVVAGASSKLYTTTTLGLLGGTTLLAIFNIFHLTLLYHLTELPTFLQTQVFSPTGSPLNNVILLIVGLVVCLTLGFTRPPMRAVAGIAGAIQLVALFAYLSLMLPGQPLAISNFPFLASWSIVLDSFKSLSGSLLGVGNANFPVLFTATKPLYLNNSPLFWNTVPQAASSTVLTLLATSGIITTILFLAFGVTTLRGLAHRDQALLPLQFAFAVIFLSFFVTNATTTTLGLFFILGGLLGSASSKPHSLSFGHLPTLFAIILGTLAAMVFGSYYFSKFVLADYHLYLAQQAISQNSGSAVYQHAAKALNLAPNLATTNLFFSQISIQLAGNLSQSVKDPTEQDRQTISQLVSDSIASAKNAVALRPNLSSAWANLSSIYRNLIGVAQDADRFALETYNKTISLDPGNPALRTELGTLYIQLASQDPKSATSAAYLNQAITQLQTATQLKPDYAPALYQLGVALQNSNNIEDALMLYKKTLTLLDPASTEYTTVQDAIKNIESPSAVPPSPSQLESEALPTPLPGGPIDLPQESPIP